MLRKVKYAAFFVILLCIFVACSSIPSYRLNPAQRAAVTRNYDEFKEQTLYVDSSFTKEEMDKIYGGAKNWELATRGLVKFTYFWYLNLNDRDVHESIDRNIVMKFHSSHPFVYYQDRLKNSNVIGFLHWAGDHYYLGIVYDRIKNDSQYLAVVIHELGHSLGLDHFNSAFAIMNESVSSNHDCLTFSDIELFCQKYHCLPYDMAFCKK